MNKKILVLGGTGAMGVYLVPKLIDMGYNVDVYSLDDIKSNNPKLRYFVADTMNLNTVYGILNEKFTAIIDFMNYSSKAFEERYKIFLDATDQYIFLSTYRVYADREHPIRETSPLLYDVMKNIDPDFYATDDYSLRKAYSEELLKNSGKTNWTIVRPAITYSKRRFQLVTLEANNFVPRTLCGKKVIVPKEALNKQATMSWGGDVAEMIARLIENDKAYGEIFTVSTSEHHTWREIAEYYRKLIGLEIIEVETETYVDVLFDANWKQAGRYQIIYDRLFDREIDNSKILNVTNMKQEDLTPLFEGLKREISNINSTNYWKDYTSPTDAKMDKYITNIGI
ncbi:MAG: NAD-dependent epimerase/dehydratase family protein [Acutalibacteraceae bacterium]|nr:NAD-dependent epimerase/dehydratase family protein [Acutalibacteraceae bacterium]